MAKSSSKAADKKAAVKAAGAALTRKRDVLKAAEGLDVTSALGMILQKKSIVAVAAEELGDDDRLWISALTETNMRPLCGDVAWLDGGIGKELAREAFVEGSKYLIAHASPTGLAARAANVDPEPNGVPVAFVRYGFELEKDADVPVLRVQTLQVEPDSQRTGLGKLLTLLTEMVGKKANVGGGDGCHRQRRTRRRQGVLRRDQVRGQRLGLEQNQPVGGGGRFPVERHARWGG